MHGEGHNDEVKDEFIEKIIELSGQNFAKCYQCGKCTAGCPVADRMDAPPSMVMRYMQLEMADELKESTSRWDCVGCLACGSRCPKFCNPASVMEALRMEDMRRGTKSVEIENLPVNFVKKAPQQALVSGFRKYVP